MLSAKNNLFGVRAIAGLMLIACILLSNTTTHAQTLDLKTAVKAAVTQSVDVAVFEAKIISARQKYKTANDMRDPELRLSRDKNYNKQMGNKGIINDESEDYEIAMRLYLSNPFIINAVQEKERIQIKLALLQLESLRHSIEADVKTLFADIIYLRGDLEIANKLIALGKENCEISEKMASENQLTAPEVMAAKLSCLQWQNSSCQIKDKLLAKLQKLAILTGINDVDQFELRGFDEACRYDDNFANIDTFLDGVVTNRIEYLTPSCLADIARADLRAARSTRIPWFSHLQCSYKEEAGTIADHSWSAQIALNLPIFSFFNNEDDHQLAVVQQQQTSMSAVKHRMYAKIKTTLRQLNSAKSELERWEKETKPMLDDMSAFLNDPNALSNLSIKTRSDIKESALIAERAKLVAQHNYNLALIRLESSVRKITGTENETADSVNNDLNANYSDAK